MKNLLLPVAAAAGGAALGYAYCDYDASTNGTVPGISYKTAMYTGLVLLAIVVWMMYKK